MKILVKALLLPFMLLASSVAAFAAPPLGTWVDDSGQIAFVLDPDGNYTMPGSTGTWSWRQTSQSGGILTLEYVNATMTQNFQDKLYFSIEYLDDNTATFSDPTSGMSGTIHRSQN
jgi:hypothetical protein